MRELKGGNDMHAFARELFPICRSITGDGTRKTLAIIKQFIPLALHEVPTGTKAFDWTVPKEWNIRDAYVEDSRGKRIIDFKKHNLHVLNYSAPVNMRLSLQELQEHLYSLPDQPSAIPYITSYYKERWGFCLAHKDRKRLRNGTYRAYIDSTLAKGHLTYGDLYIPGRTKREIFLSTYVCHPSMANNELSGPVVTTALARWIQSAPRRYSYRIVFIPETIGSLVYLSRNLAKMKKYVDAGFNITCVGDDRAYSFLPSRNGRSLADRAALHVLQRRHPDFIRYTYLDRGSDERQYCSPGVDLPIASVMRSRYGAYPEYHTSLDDLSLVTPRGLQGGLEVLKECIETLEANETYRVVYAGEPQLGKRGLYPTLSTRDSARSVQRMMDLLAYSDGSNDLISIAEIIGAPAIELSPLAERLVAAKVLRRV